MPSRADRIRTSPNFSRGAFRNVVPTSMMKGGDWIPTIKRQLFGKEHRTPSAALPLINPQHVLGTPPKSGLRLTWLGHSTLFVELDAINILTDPVWAERASPVQFLGPKRFHPVPIALDRLSAVGTVLISHDHFDHLDEGAMRILALSKARFICPLGVGKYLESWEVPADRIDEADWWESVSMGQYTFTAVPARHYSGRSLTRNRTLWASWVVRSPHRSIYLGCDSGQLDMQREIGERFGPFDVATIPIGQYGETWPEIHSFPEQSVAAAVAFKAKAMVPIHWGTFNLAFHDWTEPIERALASAREQGVRLLTPLLGEPFEPSDAREFTPWWRTVDGRTSARPV